MHAVVRKNATSIQNESRPRQRAAASNPQTYPRTLTHHNNAPNRDILFRRSCSPLDKSRANENFIISAADAHSVDARQSDPISRPMANTARRSVLTLLLSRGSLEKAIYPRHCGAGAIMRRRGNSNGAPCAIIARGRPRHCYARAITDIEWYLLAFTAPCIIQR